LAERSFAPEAGYGLSIHLPALSDVGEPSADAAFASEHVGRQVLRFATPRLNQVPSSTAADAALRDLFCVLHVPAVVELLRHLAQERTTILHVQKRHVGVLPDLLAAACSLLFPLRWCMGFVPALPEGFDLESALGSPLPMLLGCASEAVAASSAAGRVCARPEHGCGDDGGPGSRQPAAATAAEWWSEWCWAKRWQCDEYRWCWRCREHAGGLWGRRPADPTQPPAVSLAVQLWAQAQDSRRERVGVSATGQQSRDGRGRRCGGCSAGVQRCAVAGRRAPQADAVARAVCARLPQPQRRLAGPRSCHCSRRARVQRPRFALCCRAFVFRARASAGERAPAVTRSLHRRRGSAPCSALHHRAAGRQWGQPPIYQRGCRRWGRRIPACGAWVVHPSVRQPLRRQPQRAGRGASRQRQPTRRRC